MEISDVVTQTNTRNEINESDEDRPTIFEINDYENFHSLIQAAINHVLKVMCVDNVMFETWIDGRKEEVACLLHLGIETIFLKYNDSSLADFMYNFKQPNHSPSFFHFLCHLFYLVFLPYARSKMERRYLEGQNNPHHFHNTFPTLSQLSSVYPQFNVIYQSINLAFQLAYTLGRCQYHNIFTYLFGRSLSRSDGGYKKDSQTILSNEKSFKLLKLKKTAVSMVVLCVQMVEWWSRQDQPSLSLFPTHIPPYPHNEEMKNPLVLMLCPLCRKPRSQDTVLATSGYVFCSRCIRQHVNVHRTCPVTGLPSHPTTIVTLYL